MAEPAPIFDGNTTLQLDGVNQAESISPERNFQLILGGLASEEADSHVEPVAHTYEAHSGLDTPTEIARRLLPHALQFVPKLGSRYYRSSVAHKRGWDSLPEWQQRGLYVQDPSIKALPGPIREALFGLLREHNKIN